MYLRPLETLNPVISWTATCHVFASNQHNKIIVIKDSIRDDAPPPQQEQQQQQPQRPRPRPRPQPNQPNKKQNFIDLTPIKPKIVITIAPCTKHVYISPDRTGNHRSASIYRSQPKGLGFHHYRGSTILGQSLYWHPGSVVGHFGIYVYLLFVCLCLLLLFDLGYFLERLFSYGI